jgi:hypothetical protein
MSAVDNLDHGKFHLSVIYVNIILPTVSVYTDLLRQNPDMIN